MPRLAISLFPLSRAQLRRAKLLPVRFTSAEWDNGVVVVRGIIR